MRPQITFPKSLKRAMNYHEKKVQKGAAELIHAHSFFDHHRHMSFHDKRERFEDVMQLNERAKNKLIHISLNFHPSEKDRLTKAFYIQLADEYMNKIGFGNQPYLVYQHNDAGHPHIHILSTLIQDDGKRISTQFIAKNVSEPVRKEMEKKYGFVPADKKEQQHQAERQDTVNPQRVLAGKSATMRSITNVLDHVVDAYKYTSLQELNAVLKLYNVKAERGDIDGRIYKNNGLTYVVIDKEGKALTKPIKASAIYNKPTLKRLEEKFSLNEEKREPDKKSTRLAIDWAIRSKPASLADLAKLLQKENIIMIASQNEAGYLYGITYINQEKKAVFNGSDLGKSYAAKGLLERLGRVPEHSLKGAKERAKYIENNNGKGPTMKLEQNSTQAQAQVANSNELKVGKFVDRIIGTHDEDNAINRDLVNEEQKRKKKNFEKNWGL